MRRLVTFLVLGLVGNAFAAGPEFHADVVPVLRDYCVGCHNESDYEGDFSVETFRALMEGGESGAAIVAGDGHGSLLIKYLTGRTKKPMPPEKEPQPAAEEVAVLQAWIDAGAKGPEAAKDVSMLSELHVPDVPALPGVAKPVTAAAFSPDGKRFAVARYAVVEVREAPGRKALFALEGHPGKVNAVHFSADGKRIVTASGTTGLSGVAMLWDGETGKLVREFGAGHRDALFDAEFSPDGRLLATAGYDRRITIWDLKSGVAQRRIDVHNGAVFDLAFSPDGTILASASAYETVKLWKVATGERLDTLKEPQGEQYAVVFTPDGKFVVAAGADKVIRMWRLLSLEKPRINPLVRSRVAHEDAIVQLGMLADGGGLVSASEDRSLKSWMLPGLNPGRVYGGQSDVVAALAVTPEGGSLVAGRMDGTLESITLEQEAGKKGAVAESPGPRARMEEWKIAKLENWKTEPVEEVEPNDGVPEAMAVALPAEIAGTIGREGDVDDFRFAAKAGEVWIFEVEAARVKSPLDSKVEVFDAMGERVERVALQAVRDSWFTFRGKDSMISNDFRVHNWMEMELNEYLYANGEVVKLWLYPRGADSGFDVYPGFGTRHTFFGTSPLAHPLGEPCYIVEAKEPGAKAAANGLPMFRLYYENDDEPQRRWGADSWIEFTAPAEGEYVVRIRDVRGFGGEDFSYVLKGRPSMPDFAVTATGKDMKVSPGSGKEFILMAERIDDFAGEIEVLVEGLPEGFAASSPAVIERGQHRAFGVIHAAADAPAPDAEAAKKVKLIARAKIGGKMVQREVKGLGEVGLGEPAKFTLAIMADEGEKSGVAEPGKPVEFTIAPGETISARVVATRVDFEERIPLGKEDSGRNLPFGIFVDNIGLSGLLIVPGQNERQFLITAAEVAEETTRYFHVESAGVASAPAVLHVRAPDNEVSR